VAISYLEGTDGTVYGLGPRSGLAKPYGMLSAKERLVPQWSDLGRATHQVAVPDTGGTFDFDIKEPLLPPPEPEKAAGANGDVSPTESAKPRAELSPAGKGDPGREGAKPVTKKTAGSKGIAEAAEQPAHTPEKPASTTPKGSGAP
jgi:hypothetical protein